MATINPLQSAIIGSTIPNTDLSSKKTEGGTPISKTDEATFSKQITTPANDSSKVAEIKAKIANGTYKPNATAIAAKLLQEAWLTR